MKKDNFKRVICLLLAITLVCLGAGCAAKKTVVIETPEQSGENDASQNSTSSDPSSTNSTTSTSSNSSTTVNTTPGVLQNPGKWSVVAKAEMPERKDATLTLSEMQKLYRPHTEWRIYDIRTTKSTIKPKNGGRAFYVSNTGSPSNDGLSPESPLLNPYNLGKVGLKAGDVVYFERGSVFRGGWTAMVEGVTYSAYGEGKKPEFYMSPHDYADEKYWEKSAKKNIYVCTETFTKDIGGIIYNEDQSAVKVTVGSNGIFEGEKFTGYKDIKKDLYYYLDKKTGKLYFRCDAGNPGKVFDRLEFNLSSTIISIRANNVTLDNLCVKYGGGHGIGLSGGWTGLTIQNCEIGFIGGGVHSETEDGWAIRFGNGVEVWGGTENFTIKNSYFYDIYDAAMTFQYGTSTNPPPDTDIKNVNFSNNVIERCSYSVEYFLCSGKNSFIENFKIADNLMWYTGQGYCFKRYGEGYDAHIKSWDNNSGNYIKGNYNITNNLFAISEGYLVQTWSSNNVGARYDSNIYIQKMNGKLGQNGTTNSMISFNFFVKNQIETKLFDKNATVVFVR